MHFPESTIRSTRKNRFLKQVNEREEATTVTQMDEDYNPARLSTVCRQLPERVSALTGWSCC